VHVTPSLRSRRYVTATNMVSKDFGPADLGTVNKPHKHEKRPPLASLVVVLLYGVLTVGEFTVIIPTATRYIVSVGGSASLAGLVVGTRALG